jgi:protein-S-isoprenylcysteine O-methyltransferase Ste14
MHAHRDRMPARTASSVLLAARSLLWVILMPGIVAGYVPWRFFGVREALAQRIGVVGAIGLLCMTLGVALLAACVWEFARRGRGTLSPVDPPRQLVVRGLYRYVRNPMYVAVSTILLGEAILTRSIDLVLYWAVFFFLASAFVMLYEEPYLRRRFGASYDEYAAAVGRWIPRLPRRS